MLRSIFACALLFAGAVFATTYEKDGDVLVLTDDTIADAIKENEFLLVEFYAPWCGHCKTLAPEYSKAATTLAGLDTPISIAKVDATAETKSAADYGVRGYPTLKWFVNGEDTEYTGGRTADSIVSWIKKKTGPPCKRLEDNDGLDSFKEGADVVVVAFLDSDSTDFATFEKVARGVEDVEFGQASSDVAKAAGEAAGSIVLFKKFDEGKAVFSGEVTDEAVKEFIQGNSVPLVSTFSQETAPKIFGSGVENHFLYFNKAGADSHDGIFEELKKAAVDFKGKTLFVYVPSSEDRVMSYFGFKESELPKGILVAMGEGDMKKFGFDQELTADNIKAHVAAYHAGDLKPTLKSEDIPEDNSGSVQVLVGKNFEEVALDESKDVFVEFYAPWCGHCKALTPTWDELGDKFAKQDSVVIAKIDATANDVDHPKINVRGFPTLIFFPAGGKDPVTYEGGRDIDALTKFVTDNASNLSEGHVHDDL
eukprot:CAMPEP_0171471622 /NCGR_PEP_ID=MMETSP0946-20130122/812_1 /TAXON_ID=109269 /ORGANISM="Vaucheria litorea, Strain CCMP2940" /LENGTH=479 /DNA_ID=CAMNT_0012001143 /DNA_START=9 /DNA_END=1448 /DNA_ORIENTATION=+